MITQQRWHIDERPELIDKVWGRGWDLEEEEPMPFTETILCDGEVVWSIMGNEQYNEPVIPFYDAFMDSEWQNDPWSIASALDLYSCWRPLEDPHLERTFPPEVESILDISQGHVLWFFQVESLADLTGEPFRNIENIPKAFNTKRPQKIEDSNDYLINESLSLYDVLRARNSILCFRKSPSWRGASILHQSGYLKK